MKYLTGSRVLPVDRSRRVSPLGGFGVIWRGTVVCGSLSAQIMFLDRWVMVSSGSHRLLVVLHEWNRSRRRFRGQCRTRSRCPVVSASSNFRWSYNNSFVRSPPFRSSWYPPTSQGPTHRPCRRPYNDHGSYRPRLYSYILK